MGQGFISKYILRDIADYIRARKGTTDEIKPVDMRSALDSIPTYEQGKQAEYDHFWEDALKYNQYWQYRFAGKCWNDKTFAPTKDIVPIAYSSNMFIGSGIQDVKGICERLGVTIDLSQATSVNTFFADSSVKYFGVMDLRNVTSFSSGPLFNAYDLISVDKIILKDDGSQKITNFANNCRELTNIEFEGTIGYSISFVHSPLLTTQSVQSVIDHLKDLTGQAAQTLTLHADVGAKLTDAQKATITAKNWTLVY